MKTLVILVFMVCLISAACFIKPIIESVIEENQPAVKLFKHGINLMYGSLFLGDPGVKAETTSVLWADFVQSIVTERSTAEEFHKPENKCNATLELTTLDILQKCFKLQITIGKMQDYLKSLGGTTTQYKSHLDTFARCHSYVKNLKQEVKGLKYVIGTSRKITSVEVLCDSIQPNLVEIEKTANFTFDTIISFSQILHASIAHLSWSNVTESKNSFRETIKNIHGICQDVYSICK